MDEKLRTVFCGNLSEKVTEDILYELFLQAGPVQRVSIPKDRDGKQRTYGFITYKHIASVSYALRLFDGTKLFNRFISMKTRDNVELPQVDKQAQEQTHNLNNMLQLGQEMMLGTCVPYGTAALFSINVAPTTDLYPSQIDVYPYDNRRSRRVHSHHRDLDQERENHHDNRRSYRNRHQSSDYSKHSNYRSNRRNYH